VTADRMDTIVGQLENIEQKGDKDYAGDGRETDD
jgi:hypothetical protein